MNVSAGPLVKKTMSTGVHLIRDCFCKKCGKYLGWRYVFFPQTLTPIDQSGVGNRKIQGRKVYLGKSISWAQGLGGF
jgi:hypothetical protein